MSQPSKESAFLGTFKPALRGNRPDLYPEAGQSSEPQGSLIAAHNDKSTAQGVTRDSLPVKPKLITQGMLVEYDQLKPLAERFKLLEETLKRSLEAGTAVEYGPYGAYLDVDEKPRLLQQYIFDSLGLTASQIKMLRANAPLVRYRHLTVKRHCK